MNRSEVDNNKVRDQHKHPPRSKDSQSTQVIAPQDYFEDKETSRVLAEEVDIRPLKAFALRRLARGSRLRELILAEEDYLPAWIFTAYVGVWLRLLDLEAKHA